MITIYYNTENPINRSNKRRSGSILLRFAYLRIAVIDKNKASKRRKDDDGPVSKRWPNISNDLERNPSNNNLSAASHLMHSDRIDSSVPSLIFSFLISALILKCCSFFTRLDRSAGHLFFICSS